MNTKNNKRKKASVEKIESAFMELLQTKNPGNITVSEICAMAKINRSTFYANFIDIEDLGEKLKERLLEEFREVYKDEMKSRTNSNDYLKLFYHVKENQMLYRAYFKLGAGFTEREMNYDPIQAEKYFGNKNIDYHIAFFYNGLNAIIKMWLEKGCAESPEEINGIIKSEYQGREV
ncbi:MAG: TetR/AcrR family transcriptional regulator [Oscillospiraceae bacterium]|nr:TetR/AcrR family transcriptional regulator [Oscillospiraceae bacterium]